MVLLEMTARHCSCPPDPSAAAAPDAPDKCTDSETNHVWPLNIFIINERDCVYLPNVH